MLTIYSFTFNPLQENTYIVYDETKNCAIIDPGCYDREEKKELKEFITNEGLTPVCLLNTHCHIDHVLGNKYVKDEFGLKLFIHPIEEEMLRAATVYAPFYGLPMYEETNADKFFREGDVIKFGNTELDILFVPGHSPGHVAFVDHKGKNVFAGDVLFYHSIGRTDLPGGNFHTLMDSIKNNLFLLGDDYKVHPGHGPATSIGEEKKNNPYLT